MQNLVGLFSSLNDNMYIIVKRSVDVLKPGDARD
jgi:hypothetical protein